MYLAGPVSDWSCSKEDLRVLKGGEQRRGSLEQQEGSKIRSVETKQKQRAETVPERSGGLECKLDNDKRSYIVNVIKEKGEKKRYNACSLMIAISVRG